MIPNERIRTIKEYPLASHKAWEYGDKSTVLKLDWNEADLPLAAPIKEALLHFIEHEPMSWYPDVANRELAGAIATYAGVAEECVQYFEGSDCGLDYAVRTFLDAGDEAILAAPTYDNFRVYVESVGAFPKQIFGKTLRDPDVDSLEAAITGKTKLIYIVNPNNPTGALYDPAAIEQFVAKHPSILFIIDEAYMEFSGATVAPLVTTYSNLLVSRSFSKAFGLASFRIGYLVSAPENIQHINKIRNGKNISALAQIAAVVALRNRSYMDAYVQEVRAASAYACAQLVAMGFETEETAANFILVKTSMPDALRSALAKEKIFIRGLSHLAGMESYVRITVGSKRSMERLVTVVQKLLADKIITP